MIDSIGTSFPCWLIRNLNHNWLTALQSLHSQLVVHFLIDIHINTLHTNDIILILHGQLSIFPAADSVKSYYK